MSTGDDDLPLPRGPLTEHLRAMLEIFDLMDQQTVGHNENAREAFRHHVRAVAAFTAATPGDEARSYQQRYVGVVYARCPRCQTWVSVATHSERECQRWMTLRSDPSHEHRWHFIDAKAMACLDCHALGEIQYRAAELSEQTREGTTT